MIAFVATSLTCLAWLTAGLVVARCISSRGHHMIDLLEDKLELLDADVDAGVLTEDERAVVCAQLLKHTDTICAMQELLRAAPLRSMAYAQVVTTSGTPHLHIYFRPGHLYAWRKTLAEHQFTEVGPGADWIEFDGAYTVRISYLPKAKHGIVPRVVAA
jgi:hypothetical protein